MESTALVAGRYQIGSAIGIGATGCVYLGCDIQTGAPVVIKAMRRDLLAGQPEFLERFRREARVLADLDHPNIVKLLATVEEGDEHSLVMQYAGSRSLADVLRREPQLPVDRVIAIGRGVAAGLAEVHRMRILHRDLKPSNILIADDGAPLLTDFGLARCCCCDALTSAGALVGTFQYVCPEAWHGARLDERADIWSFGVVLYEMLAGVRPFDGESPYEIMWAINNEPLPDLSGYRAGVPEGLQALVRHMLMRDVAGRIASACEVEAELALSSAGEPGWEPCPDGVSPPSLL